MSSIILNHLCKDWGRTLLVEGLEEAQLTFEDIHLAG